MQPVPKLYCVVDLKTGTVVEGPRELPQKWGNISGFNNLRENEVKKYGWYPMAEYSLVNPKDTKFSLVFLPEQEVVVKTNEDANRGLKDTAVLHLAVQFKHNITNREVMSDVLGPTYYFPNTEADQIMRLTCMVTGAPYECMARLYQGNTERVVVPSASIPRLIEDAAKQYKQRLGEFEAGVTRINGESLAGLRALMDTQFAELYDD